jgi:hypothetical protein
MILPPKSRYSISEAVSYITSSLGESVTTGQVLDWGAQELYKLHLSVGNAIVRQGEKISHITDCLVEIRPTTEQASQLAQGAKISISDCWRDNEKFEFVRGKLAEYGGGYKRDHVNVATRTLAITGQELHSFVGRITSATTAAIGAASSVEQVASEFPTGVKTWKEYAREIADTFFDHDTNANPSVRDSLAGYADRVMAEMQKRKIHSPRGAITNASTISREALQGLKWWAKKQK